MMRRALSRRSGRTRANCPSRSFAFDASLRERGQLRPALALVRVVRLLLSAAPMLSAPSVRRALVAALALALALSVAPRSARADVVPPPTDLPSMLTMDEALRIFRARGLDLLMAEAAVYSAEGDVRIAGAIANPGVSVGYGRILNYDPAGCEVCSANTWSVGVTDNAALEDTLSGKRALRLRVARAALAAAKMSRVDAQRNLEFQIKSAYIQVAQAKAALDFAKEVQASNTRTLELNRLRYPQVIDEGALARIETQKLESDQAVDVAVQNARLARVGLAFFLGVRGKVPDFEVDQELKYAVPPQLATASEDALLRSAVEHRPDLRAIAYQRARAEAGLALARRQRFPDIALSVNYTQTGYGGTGSSAALGPPQISFGLSAPIPIFYQQQGEIRKAEADFNMQQLSYTRSAAQVVADVSSAYASFTTAKRLVERMEGGLLERAKKARDIVEIQFKAGSATLIDYLDAQRTFIATNVEYRQDLTMYWTAIFQLEQAVGMELRK
jgi:cobalt-zinc-cadmium efflux system outer membrane protein